MNRQILRIALPSIASNITVPLLALMDVAIVGHLGSTVYIGAIAVAGMLFSMLYWGFGFLRMGTGGLTAQAYGREDKRDIMLQFYRAQSVALIIAGVLIAASVPLQQLCFLFIDATPSMRYWASVYFYVCIFGAPAVLGSYALTGWFIGMQNSMFPMMIAIAQNIVNIALSLLFVYVFDMGVRGVALGTLCAQWSGFLFGWMLWWRRYSALRSANRFSIRDILQRSEMKQYFALNRNIFGRTLCLIAVTSFFTAAGARQGDVILAVNTLLIQLFTLFSYIMDGFAYAGEALAGRYYGARDRQNLMLSVRIVFRWGIVLTAIFTVLYTIYGHTFISLLTTQQEVIAAAVDYSYWVAAIPICGFAAFLWDGVFIGLTAAKQMLIAMIVASGSFFCLYYALVPVFGNHALWLAFMVYLSLRGILQWCYYRKRIVPLLP